MTGAAVGIEADTSSSGGTVPLLEVDRVVREFRVDGGWFRRPRRVRAVAGVSLDVAAGETVGVVGESGCGKSTLARLIVGLLEPTSGAVRLEGRSVADLDAARYRSTVQMVFQDPFASLNPRMTVGEMLAEPLAIHHGVSRRTSQSDVEELLETVGLAGEHRSRYPHEFSGGQRQRIGIARALAVRPRLLVLDEPVSALDVSIQAGIVNLLMRLQRERDLGVLFIAHDLSVVRHISDRVAVMYLGKVMEFGRADDIYRSPLHPYTQALLSAVPVPDPSRERERHRIVLRGEIPSASDPPSGCPLRTRCWKAEDRCATDEPPLVAVGGAQQVACHFPAPTPAPAPALGSGNVSQG